MGLVESHLVGVDPLSRAESRDRFQVGNYFRGHCGDYLRVKRDELSAWRDYSLEGFLDRPPWNRPINHTKLGG